jgi:hypothetical protein
MVTFIWKGYQDVESKLNDTTFDLEEFRFNHCNFIISENDLWLLNNVLWYHYQFIPYLSQQAIFKIFDFSENIEFLPKAIEFHMNYQGEKFEVALIDFFKEGPMSNTSSK